MGVETNTSGRAPEQGGVIRASSAANRSLLAQALASATGKYQCRHARHDQADTDHESLTHHDPPIPEVLRRLRFMPVAWRSAWVYVLPEAAIEALTAPSVPAAVTSRSALSRFIAADDRRSQESLQPLPVTTVSPLSTLSARATTLRDDDVLHERPPITHERSVVSRVQGRPKTPERRMAEDQMPSVVDFTDVEAELCRLPDVTAVRIVADEIGRPIEVHVLARSGKPAKQVVRDVQSVAMASFGIELDRRIVSVVQLAADGTTMAEDLGTAEPTSRPRIVTTHAQTTGLRTIVQVTLASDADERTGFAEGSVAAATRPRIIANATLDALRQLEPAAECLDVDTALVTRAGSRDVVVVLLVSVDPPHERHLSGSAIVHQHADDAVVRAVLDATNRRLPHLGRDRDRS